MIWLLVNASVLVFHLGAKARLLHLEQAGLSLSFCIGKAFVVLLTQATEDSFLPLISLVAAF